MLVLNIEFLLKIFHFQAGWTALMWACYKGNTDVAKFLLLKEANPNVKGEVSHNILVMNFLFEIILQEALIHGRFQVLLEIS